MAMAVMPSKTSFLPLGERRFSGRQQVLNSWKEIADFLKCGVRTAQRWELDLELPVYRPRPGKRGPVCAFPVEIQMWLRRNQHRLNSDSTHDQRTSAAATAHQLIRQSSELVRITAANTRVQQEYAARLLETIEKMKTRLERRSRLVHAG